MEARKAHSLTVLRSSCTVSVPPLSDSSRSRLIIVGSPEGTFTLPLATANRTENTSWSSLTTATFCMQLFVTGTLAVEVSVTVVFGDTPPRSTEAFKTGGVLEGLQPAV